MNPDEILDYCGRDVTRLHEAYADALAMPPGGPRDVLLTQLRHLLGWPLPTTPPEEVLAGAGSAGIPVARVLAIEEARPARFRRPDLIAKLRDRAEGAGAAATAIPTSGLGGVPR